MKNEGETQIGPRIVGVKAHACDFGVTFAPLYEDDADPDETDDLTLDLR